MLEQLPLFAYGTLRSPEVVMALLGKNVRSAEARLPDYTCIRVRSAIYPGILPQAGASVEGTLLFDLHQDDLALLDHYEDDFYVRTRLLVSAIRESAPPFVCLAWVYVVPSDEAHCLTTEMWNWSDFADRELSGFLQRLESCNSCRVRDSCAMPDAS